MSKLTFGSAFLSDNSGGRTAILKNGLGDLMESTNMTKMSLWFEGAFFVCSPFFVLGELALCKSPRRLLFCQRVTESPIMSDCL